MTNPDQQRVAQVGQVFPALSQGRDIDHNNVKPVEQILAEPAGLDLVLEVAVRGGDDPDVDLARLGTADAAHLAVLERAEKLGLQIDRQLAELVEEQGAAVGAIFSRIE